MRNPVQSKLMLAVLVLAQCQFKKGKSLSITVELSPPHNNDTATQKGKLMHW